MFSQLFRNSIFRAYGTSLLGVVSGLLTNLWLLREITRAIPVHDFGIYAFVLQISGYLAMLQLGLDFAASRQIAESLGKNDRAQAASAFRDLVKFNHKIVFLAIAAVLAISGLLWSGIAFRHSIAASATSMAASVALATGMAQVITFLTRPHSAALIGSQFQATVNIWTAGRTFATTLLAFVFLKCGFYVLAVPVAEIVAQTVTYFALRTFASRQCEWKKIPPTTEKDKAVLGSMLRYGGLTSLGGFAWTIESGMDVVILGTYTNSAVVASYVLWWRFPQMIFDLCTRLAFSAFPKFSNSFGVSRDAARTVFNKVIYITLGLSTLALVGISFWLQPFVKLWIGSDYLGEQSVHLAFFMGLLVCLRACGNLLGMFWMSSGQAGFTTSLAWAQAGAKVLLALLLVPKMGILGVVIASCTSAFLQVAAMAWYLARQKLLTAGIGFRSVVFLVIALIAAFHAPTWLFPAGWAGLIIGATATALVWLAIWIVIVATSEFRRFLTPLLLRLPPFRRS